MPGRRSVKRSKTSFTKTTDPKAVSRTDTWRIVCGELKRKRGRPSRVRSLFKVVAEKIPKESVDAVAKKLREWGIQPSGVYIAHDSMGNARYVGRGQDVFVRLKERFRAQTLELLYFSFYIVEDPTHISEVETIMIRAAGSLLHFNDRKRRIDIQAGDVKDFEAGTRYFQRQYIRGRRVKA